MKFIVQKEPLLKAVQDVQKAVSSKTPMPILTGIKITTTTDEIKLTGSDSDISIESTIPLVKEDQQIAEIIVPGAIVLQSKYFGEIVKKLPEAFVEIEVFEHFHTKIKSGSAEFLLHGLDPSDYPNLPQISNENTIQIPVDLLKECIRQTVFAVSTQETRPILTGVHWKIEDATLIAVATDSHRLALRQIPISYMEQLNIKQAVIPGKSLNELNKILEDSAEPIDIVLTENHILFKTNHLIFLSRLLEGNYPDTSRLIPPDNKTEIIVSSKQFLQAIDRASLLVREDKNNIVKLATINQKQIQITSTLSEIGKVVEDVICNDVTGEEMKISFSSKYMMDAVRALDGTEIKISFTGAMRPFLIRSLYDDSSLQLILPIRTN